MSCYIVFCLRFRFKPDIYSLRIDLDYALCTTSQVYKCFVFVKIAFKGESKKLAVIVRGGGYRAEAFVSTKDQ